MQPTSQTVLDSRMCMTVTVGETGRRVMGMATTVINIVLVFLSLVLLIAAVGIRHKLDERLELMNGYYSGALPIYMMLAGGLMFCIHLVAIKFCHDETSVATRSEKRHLFVALIFIVIGMFVFVFITIIFILVHAAKIRASLEEGIGHSMKAYKSDLVGKQTVDNLQMEFECCGVKSNKDWFHLGWVNPMYINTESDDVKMYLKGDEVVTDDAPASCCSRDAKRACVNHSVLDFTSHRNYDVVTLNGVGCSDAVMAYFNSAPIVPTTLLLFVILVLQAIDIILMRLLQTSILTADEMNDSEAATEAYCIKGLGGGGNVRELFKRKKEDSDDDDDSDDKAGSKRKKPKPKEHVKADEDDDDDGAVDDQPRGGGRGRGGFSRIGSGGGRDSKHTKKDKNKSKKREKEDKKKKKKRSRN